jgi:hypothetical protein
MTRHLLPPCNMPCLSHIFINKICCKWLRLHLKQTSWYGKRDTLWTSPLTKDRHKEWLDVTNDKSCNIKLQLFLITYFHVLFITMRGFIYDLWLIWTPSAAQTVYFRTVGQFVDNELERCRRDWAQPTLRYCPNTLLSGLRKTTTIEAVQGIIFIYLLKQLKPSGNRMYHTL